MITKEMVREAQSKWAQGIVEIGKFYTEKKDYRKRALEFLRELYNYDEGIVLFKPTKAKEKQFRLTLEEALSYFVGNLLSEDKGFALEPWINVEFEPAGDIIIGEVAISQGNYYFTSGKTKERIKVEFTFVYKLINGTLKIIAHHSSLPFSS